MSCRESIIQQAGTQKFSSFLGAIFDTLLYQLNDSMTRITNVHRMELEKENGKITMYNYVNDIMDGPVCYLTKLPKRSAHDDWDWSVQAVALLRLH